MKNLSPLQIRNRINRFGYSIVKRKLTELEKERIFNMEQILIKIQIEISKSVIISDRF